LGTDEIIDTEGHTNDIPACQSLRSLPEIPADDRSHEKLPVDFVIRVDEDPDIGNKSYR